MSLLIRNVMLNGMKRDIYVEDNIIEGIDERIKIRADKVIDGKNKAAIPGFVNAHTHAAMTLFRGYGDDMELHEWLQNKIWPAEAKLTEKDVYWGTKLACLEMIKSGTTTFNDQYWFMKGTARAVNEMGLRAVLAEAFIDLFQREMAEKSIRNTKRFVRFIDSMNNDRISAAIGPHAIYSVSKECLQWVREFSEKNNLLIHFHLSETNEENGICKRKYGKRPVEYLEEIGFLGDNLIAAHCVWLNKRDIKILSRYNVKIVHNPTSNMKLSVGGFFDYKGIRSEGLIVSLGTDGCASNNNLDMFEEMKFAAVAQKGFKNDPTIMSALETFKMATEYGAKTLGINAGKIEIGKLADIALIDLKRPEMLPMHNLVSNLVYSANGSCVDTLICNGEVLMENRKVEGEEEILEKAEDIAFNLISR